MPEIKYVTLELLSRFKTNADALYATKDDVKAVQDQIDGLTGGGVVTGIKGSAEAEYRKGQIEITPANIGLDKVENTADAEKVVAEAGKLTTAQNISITGGATAAAVAFDGTGEVALNVTALDASKITGVISIDNLPAAALERLVVVENEAAMLALTADDVQVGDSVQIGDGLMYRVIDASKLGTMEAFKVYTAGSAASVPWEGVTGKPTEFTAAPHTHTASEITDFEASVKEVKVDAAGTAEKLTTDAGASNKPVYVKNGVPVECGFTVEASVPADAKFTDTTYGEATSEAPGLMSPEEKVKLASLVAASEADIDALFA